MSTAFPISAIAEVRFVAPRSMSDPAAEQPSIGETISRTRVVVVCDRALVREGLVALLESTADWSVVASCETVDEAMRHNLPVCPDAVLYGFTTESRFVPEVARLHAGFPQAKVLTLDDAPSDGRVLLVLRSDVRAYLTTRQPFVEIAAALRKALQGERIYHPDVASRLSITADGIRLARGATDEPFAHLTPREREVMTYLALGHTVKQTANTLGLRPSTVDNHKTRLMKKLKVHKTVELTRLAMRHGLFGAESTSASVELDSSGRA